MAKAAADVGGEVPEAPGGPQTTPVQGRAKVTLPTQKTGGMDAALEQMTILLYGPPGIGKSTLASQFPRPLFFDCAGELTGISTYSVPVLSFEEFTEVSAALAEDAGKNFGTGVIDTMDVLGMYARAYANRRLGITHESDAEYGKGWDNLKNELYPRLAKLSALPTAGLIMISHAKTVEIKTTREAYDKSMPTLTGGIRDGVLRAADLVLFIDWGDDDEESRTIYTKPHKYHEAKERGEQPRLPEQIEWPIGENGYEILNQHWTKGKK